MRVTQISRKQSFVPHGYEQDGVFGALAGATHGENVPASLPVLAHLGKHIPAAFPIPIHPW